MPKPFSKVKALSFDLTSNARPIFITVHTVKGRRIRSLPFSTASSGRLNASWDGCDASGSRVGAGKYIVTVIQSGRTMSRKIELIK
jgi:flagellar hook assembly protein FlgD